MKAPVSLSSPRTAAFLLACFILITNPSLLRAGETDPAREKALALQNYYTSLTSITFDFTQVSRTSGRERTGEGNAVFAKLPAASQNSEPETSPNSFKSIMRWNYTEPDRQVIINDGTILSIYTDRDRQLIKTSARELESDITYAFFTGRRDLLEDFDVLPADGDVLFSSAENLQALKLVPVQPHNQIRTVFIWADNENIIHHMLIEDHFDSITELHFTNIALNPLQPVDEKAIAAITEFIPPPGTEIITQ